MSVPAEKVELLVNTDKPSVQCERLQTSRYDTIIPTGRVAWIKCPISPDTNLSEFVFLFQPDENNTQLTELDVYLGLLGVQNPKKPYVSVPVGNNTKHTITLPRKTAFTSIHCVEKVIMMDLLEKSEPTVTVNSFYIYWHQPISKATTCWPQRS